MQPMQAEIRAFIGIGSNLDDPVAQVRAAFAALAELPGSRLTARSGLYRSKPLAGMAQPDYINAVALLDTRLEPQALLEQLQGIEAGQGRTRNGERWAARTLDLDLLLYGDRRITTPCLTVPHPELRVRAFVLYPLQEVAAGLILPDGVPLAELLPACPSHDLSRVADA